MTWWFLNRGSEVKGGMQDMVTQLAVYTAHYARYVLPSRGSYKSLPPKKTEQESFHDA